MIHYSYSASGSVLKTWPSCPRSFPPTGLLMCTQYPWRPCLPLRHSPEESSLSRGFPLAARALASAQSKLSALKASTGYIPIRHALIFSGKEVCKTRLFVTGLWRLNSLCILTPVARLRGPPYLENASWAWFCRSRVDV